MIDRAFLRILIVRLAPQYTNKVKAMLVPVNMIAGMIDWYNQLSKQLPSSISLRPLLQFTLLSDLDFSTCKFYQLLRWL